MCRNVMCVRGTLCRCVTSQDYVMMTKWLPTDAPNTLPPNASHQVGVGAIVVNDQQQVLVVQEANGPLRGQGVWKMPTGLVHAGKCQT